MSSPETFVIWNDLPTDEPMPGIIRRRLIGEKAMVSHVTLEAGRIVPIHSHPNEQITCILEGRLKLMVAQCLGKVGAPASRAYVLTPGQALLIPANVRHSAEVLEKTVVLDIFSPPSAGTGLDAKRA